MTTTPDNQLPLLVLSRPEVAECLRVTEDTVENLHRTHQLRGAKIGKRLVWKVEDVKAFVNGLTTK